MPSRTRYAVDCEVQGETSASAALAHEVVLDQIDLQLLACADPELESRLRDRRAQAVLDRDGERAAARYLREKSDSALHVVGQAPASHGEVLEHDGSVAHRAKSSIRHPDQVQIDSSADRKRLLVGQPVDDVAALGLDLAASVGAQNTTELMLSHQMAALHRAGMQTLEDGLKQPDMGHRARLLNTASRCMTAFQSAALTLQRLQQGVRQDVHVRHVHVHEGAQAVIGSVETGGLRKFPRGE